MNHHVRRSLEERLGQGLVALWQSSQGLLWVTALAAGLVLGLRQAGQFEPYELATFDQFMRWRSPDAPDDRIMVVGVTTQDLQYYSQPLSAEVMIDVLAVLDAADPAAIGLAFPWTENDRLPDLLAMSDRLVVSCQVSPQSPTSPLPSTVHRDRLGVVNLPQDLDGVVRRAWIGLVPPSAPSPMASDRLSPCQNPAEPLSSLSVQVATQYLQRQGVDVISQTNGLIQLGAIALPPLSANAGSYQRTEISGYQLMLNYRSPDAIEQVSLTDVLTGQVPLSRFRDRVVLIGPVLPAAAQFATPHSHRSRQPMSAVMIHAQATSQLLSAALGQRPLIWFWSNGVEGIWIIVWAGVGGSLASWLQYPRRWAIAAVLSMGVLWGIGFGLFLQAGWIPIIAPATAFLLAGVGMLVMEHSAARATTAETPKDEREEISGAHPDRDRPSPQPTALSIHPSTSSPSLPSDERDVTKPGNDVTVVPGGARPSIETVEPVVGAIGAPTVMDGKQAQPSRQSKAEILTSSTTLPASTVKSAPSPSAPPSCVDPASSPTPSVLPTPPDRSAIEAAEAFLRRLQAQ